MIIRGIKKLLRVLVWFPVTVKQFSMIWNIVYNVFRISRFLPCLNNETINSFTFL